MTSHFSQPRGSSKGASLQFEVSGLERKNWSDATLIRKVFRNAFPFAGLPYFNPHSFRKTLARLGEQLCHSAEQFKAWSQNLGHEGVLTTFLSYGEVAPDRQEEIIRGFAKIQPAAQSQADEIVEAIFKKLSDTGLSSRLFR